MTHYERIDAILEANDGLPYAEIAEIVLSQTGITLKENALRARRSRMKKKTPNLVAEEREKINAKADTQHDKQALKQAISVIETLEREKEALLAIKNGVESFVIKPKSGTGSEATAIWLASDWHVGEKVTRGQTNGLNEYNPTISKARGEAYFRNGLRLTDMAGRDVKIDTIVLALLGDFITGHLHLDAIENNWLAPVEETLHAQKIITSGIEYILKHSKYNLIIPCASGNHGRTTKFSHFGSENGHSLEYFMYCSLAQYFRNEKRVKFIISEGAHTYLDIYSYTVRLLHGHDIKYNGGSGGITIPLNKAIGQWDKARPAYLTVCGHFHQRFDGGAFCVNGSLIGYNAFALSIKASAERPQQSFILVDKKRGKTITAPILVEE